MVIWLSINFFSAPIRGYFLLSNYFLLNLPYLSIITLLFIYYLPSTPYYRLFPIHTFPSPQSTTSLFPPIFFLSQERLSPCCYHNLSNMSCIPPATKKSPYPLLSSLQVRSTGSFLYPLFRLYRSEAGDSSDRLKSSSSSSSNGFLT